MRAAAQLVTVAAEPGPGHHRRMTQDQPETAREQLAREAVEAYNELTAHAEELSPEAAQAVRSLRETLTSLVALGTAADLQIAEMERTMEEFESIFYSGDVTVSARLLRRHLTAEQRAELARLITEP
jgi:beta-phosphoglucomutase-like phosphatase (HAD superfamily)